MEEHKVLKVTRQTTKEELNDYAQQADFVFHLAGVNRPEKEKEFVEGNVDFTQTLLNVLIKAKNKAPILITSSTQAANDSAYGQSKKAGEDLVFKYGKNYGVKTYVYRLPNLFGKWSRPNYNTVIATFSHKIARGEKISINDPNVELTLVYIDDLVEEFSRALNDQVTKDGEYCVVP